MKRLIIFICLIIIVILGFIWIENGFDNAAYGISSYNEIEDKYEKLATKIADYKKTNVDEYNTAQERLKTSKTEYKSAKEAYEQILAELEDVLKNSDNKDMNEVIEEIIYSDQEKYKVDFLLVTLGEYGEKEGVDVYYQLTTSEAKDPNESKMNFFLADLKFKITGQYMDVTNFISDLENDSKLSWEIRDFDMNKAVNGVTAAFTIYSVPIDTESWLAESSMDAAAAQNQGNGDATNTVDNTVDNTTAEASTEETTDTVDNTVTNSVEN